MAKSKNQFEKFEDKLLKLEACVIDRILTLMEQKNIEKCGFKFSISSYSDDVYIVKSLHISGILNTKGLYTDKKEAIYLEMLPIYGLISVVEALEKDLIKNITKLN